MHAVSPYVGHSASSRPRAGPFSCALFLVPSPESLACALFLRPLALFLRPLALFLRPLARFLRPFALFLRPVS